jgi:hypothetical protein
VLCLGAPAMGEAPSYPVRIPECISNPAGRYIVGYRRSITSEAARVRVLDQECIANIDNGHVTHGKLNCGRGRASRVS